MEISERMIEDLIYDCVKGGEIYKLRERGLFSFDEGDLIFRQVDLGDYGRLDMVGLRYRTDILPFERKRFDINLVEIKKGIINAETLFQAIRYCKGLELILEKYNMCAKFSITLIGSCVDLSDFIYCADFFENLAIYTIKLDIEKGVRFKREISYCLTNSRDVVVPEATRSYIFDHIKKVIREKIYWEI